ncbi:unnamed protein product, partial [Owenia fusiformis]
GYTINTRHNVTLGLKSTDEATKELTDDYPCPQCSNLFPSPRCLDYHKMVVHNKFCDVCGHRIDDDLDVTHHGQQHTGLKPYQCYICYKLFAGVSGISAHVAKDLKCLLCGRQFQRGQKNQHFKHYHR